MAERLLLFSNHLSSTSANLPTQLSPPCQVLSGAKGATIVAERDSNEL